MRKTSKSSNSTKKSLLSKAASVKGADLPMTALFYGRSGTGKTTLSGTFPKPLFLDVGERGTDSVSDTDAESLLIQSAQDFEDVYWELKEGKHGYQTVVVDALHSLQGLAVQKAKADAKKSEDGQTSQRDFGQASGWMNQWVLNYRDLRDVGIRVVFLAHDKVHEFDTDDEESIVPEVGPRLMPSVASCVVGAVNVIGYTFIRANAGQKKLGKKQEVKMEYCLRVGPNSLYTTKVRKPKSGAELPEFIIDPTYDKLKQLTKGTAPSNRTKRTKRSK